jgi:hypothetical protein
MATKPYSNNTQSERSCPEYNLGLASNYTVIGAKNEQLTNKMVLLDNLCAPKKKELIRLEYKTLPQVNTDGKVEFPTPVRTGYQIRVSLDDILSGTAPDGVSTYEVPVKMYLTVCAPDALVTSQDLEELFERFVSIFHKSDGTWRWEALARGSILPTAD